MIEATQIVHRRDKCSQSKTLETPPTKRDRYTLSRRNKSIHLFVSIETHLNLPVVPPQCITPMYSAICRLRASTTTLTGNAGSLNAAEAAWHWFADNYETPNNVNQSLGIEESLQVNSMRSRRVCGSYWTSCTPIGQRSGAVPLALELYLQLHRQELLPSWTVRNASYISKWDQ